MRKNEIHTWYTNDTILKLDLDDEEITLGDESGDDVIHLFLCGVTRADRNQAQYEFLKELSQAFSEAADLWGERRVGIPSQTDKTPAAIAFGAKS